MPSLTGLPPQLAQPRTLPQGNATQNPASRPSNDQVHFGARPNARMTADEINKKEIEAEIQDRVKAKAGQTLRTDILNQCSTLIQQRLKNNPNAVSPRTTFLDSALTETTQRLVELAKKPQPKMSQETKEFLNSIEPDVLTTDLNQTKPNSQELKLIQDGLQNKLRGSLGKKYENRLPAGLIQDEVLNIYQNYQKVPTTYRAQLLDNVVTELTQKPKDPNFEDVQNFKATRVERKQASKDKKEAKRQQIEQKALKDQQFNQSYLGRAYNWFYSVPTTEAVKLDRTQGPDDMAKASTETAGGAPPPTTAAPKQQQAKGLSQRAQEKMANSASRVNAWFTNRFQTEKPAVGTTSPAGGAEKPEAQEKKPKKVASAPAAIELKEKKALAAEQPEATEGDKKADGVSGDKGSQPVKTELPKTETPKTDEKEVKAAEGPEKPTETPPTTDTNSAPKAETPKTDDAKKEANNEGVLKGWVGTKMGLGAALLAGGIALKMTLIGIVPGLIMAGVGAALMGWGAINYLFNNKKEEPKTEATPAPSPAANS